MVFVPKPSWDKGTHPGLPGSPAAPGVVRSVLFLLIDHRACRIQHVNQTWSLKQYLKKSKKKKRGNEKKNRNIKKKEKNVELFVLYCHWFEDQHIFRPSQTEIRLTFWELFLAVLSMKQVECLWCNLFSMKHILVIHFWLLTELKLCWSQNPVKTHRSDLIWSDLIDYLWLVHCGWVCLLVRWQWSSVCLTFRSDRPHFMLRFSDLEEPSGALSCC